MKVQEIPQDFKYAAIQHSLDHMKAKFAQNEQLANRIRQLRENYKRDF